MTSTLRLASLLLAGLMFTACDDDETTSNVPPDLKLEDVVGCWYFGGGGYCRLKCYDPGFSGEYIFYDSTDRSQFEAITTFSLDDFWLREVFVSKSSEGSREDSGRASTAYRRGNGVLYVLDSRYQLGDGYTSVNLDSTLPCGKPFLLFPKPANWTLF